MYNTPQGTDRAERLQRLPSNSTVETKPTHLAVHLALLDLPLACSSRNLTTNVFKSPASSFSRSSSRRLLHGAVSAATRTSARVLILGCRSRLLTSLVAICFWAILQSDSVQSTSDFISRISAQISAEATAVSQQKRLPERAARHAAVVLFWVNTRVYVQAGKGRH